MSGRILVNSPGLLIWTGTPSTALSPDPGTEAWGGRRKESWRPAGVPGGELNLESTEGRSRYEYSRPHHQVRIKFFFSLSSPRGQSSDSKLSGEALPGEGSFVGGEAPLLVSWETPREPWGWRHCRPTRLHYAWVGGRGTTKQVCWRSGGGGGVLLGPVTWCP